MVIRNWFAAVGLFLIFPAMAIGQDKGARPEKGPRDGDRPKVDAPERKDPRAQFDQILELQKAMGEAMRANDPEKTKELLLKLQQLMQVERPGAFQLQIQPFPLLGREQPQPKNDLRVQYEKQLKEFAESIEKLKDDQEARGAIEKARDEYKKAMEAELKKADEAQPAPRPIPVFPDFPRVPRNELVPFPAFDLGLRNPRLTDVQPRLGVQLEKPSAVLADQLDLKPNTGLVILEAMRGTPADKAGLKKNDVLLQWAGKDVASDVEAFQALIAATKAGEKFEAVVLRKGKKEIVSGIEMPESRRLDLGNFNQVQMQIDGDTASLQATARGVKYDIAGTMEGRKLVPNKIVVMDRDETLTYESLEKVPEKYRPIVEKLIGRLGRE